MEWIITFLKNPLTMATLAGLAAGLTLSLIVLIRTRIYRSELEQEISDTRYDYRRLEEQMNAQMRVSSKAQDDLQSTVDDQLKQIKNLQVTLETLSQKPGKKELRTLHLLQRALELMEKDSPNAMLAWGNAKNNAIEEFGQIEKGLKPMLRKVFSKSE